MCLYTVCTALRGQKRVANHLELELQTIVSSHVSSYVGAENQPSTLKEQPVLLTLQTLDFFFFKQNLTVLSWLAWNSLCKPGWHPECWS